MGHNEGMFVFQENAKLQISLLLRDAYKAFACPRATLAKINTTKVIAIPIIAKAILSFYCTCSVPTKYTQHKLLPLWNHITEKRVQMGCR